MLDRASEGLPQGGRPLPSSRDVNSLTHSLTGAIPPGGGIGGAAHNRSCVHSRARPELLFVHRRLERDVNNVSKRNNVSNRNNNNDNNSNNNVSID